MEIHLADEGAAVVVNYPPESIVTQLHTRARDENFRSFPLPLTRETRDFGQIRTVELRNSARFVRKVLATNR